MSTYSNPYMDGDITPQYDKLPLADTDYDVLAALKYTELMHKQLIKQYNTTFTHVAVCPDISTTNIDSKRRLRRVIQLCDDCDEPLPDCMFDVLNYVDDNVVDMKLTDDDIQQFQFTYIPKPVIVAPPPMSAPPKSVKPAPVNNNVANKPQQQTHTAPAAKRLKLEPAPAVNLVKSQPAAAITPAPPTIQGTASDWQFGAQRDQYGHAVKQRTLFGMSKPVSKAPSTTTPLPSPPLTPAQPPKQDLSVITLATPHTIAWKTPFAINNFPRSIKSQLFNYRVPRLRSEAQFGTHILLWIDAARHVSDTYAPLQLAMFMHSRLTLPIVAVVACESTDTAINTLARTLQATYSIPLICIKSSSYGQTCDAVRQWCDAVKPHAIVTEELFEDCRTLLKQNMVAQLSIQCSVHAVDDTHIIPVRYMPVNVGESRVDLYALLLSKLRTAYNETADSETERPLLNMTVQAAVDSISDHLPVQLAQTLLPIAITRTTSPTTESIVSPTVDSIRSSLQCAQYTVTSLITTYVQSRCTTLCTCNNSSSITPPYITCGNTHCRCNACRVFNVLFNELVDYHLQDINLHTAAQQQ